MRKVQDAKQVVLTLDAGGTNFVFSAMRKGEEVTEPVRFPSYAHDLGLCLSILKKGFREVMAQIDQKPQAISFAFPGPANYPQGIIGDLPNLPAFRGGVPLKSILEHEFKVPVFINNDGDLFAYGEAIAGFLPDVNQAIVHANGNRTYKSLFAITLGTGTGCGFVYNGELFVGDNFSGAEIWNSSSRYVPCNVEAGASVRAVRRVYAEQTKSPPENAPEPAEIYDIAIGNQSGDKEAARHAFTKLGKILGDKIADVMTFLDGGLVVIGGGVAGAKEFIVPAMLEEMNSTYTNYSGQTFPRLTQKVYFLDDDKQFQQFVQGKETKLSIPESNEELLYDPETKIGIGFSRVGTSRSISLGAYAFAVNRLEK